MSLERRYVDILTMGRSGIDIFPLQVGAHLEDVETFGKFLGGSPTNVAVAAAQLGHRAGVITGVGDDPFGRFVTRELERLGVSREKLEAGGNLDRLLNWQKTGLISLAVPFGDTTIYTEARLALRTGADGRLSLNIHTLRREPQLDFPYMGHTFSPEEKEQLLTQGNLGKTVELSPKKGEPFRAYVSVDRLTNELVSLRADRVQIPNEIKGVRLSEEQHRALTEGRPVQVEGMLSRHGKPFDATLQVNAEKRGIEFIFKDSLSNKERLKSSAKEAPAVRQTENKPQKRGIGR